MAQWVSAMLRPSAMESASIGMAGSISKVGLAGGCLCGRFDRGCNGRFGGLFAGGRADEGEGGESGQDRAHGQVLR